MARWQDPHLPIIATSGWKCLPGLLQHPPPAQIRSPGRGEVLGKSLSAAGGWDRCRWRELGAQWDAQGGGRAKGFHFSPAIISKKRLLVAAPGR